MMPARSGRWSLLPLLLGGCAAIPASQPARHGVVHAAPGAIAAPAIRAEPQRAPTFMLQGPLTQGGLVLGTAPPGIRAVTLDGSDVPLARDGRFLIGFGRDAASTAILAGQMADGGMIRQVLTIAPRQWDIQSLPTLPKGTKPTAEFLRRRAIELAQIQQARAQLSPVDGWQQRVGWPVTGRISGVFGSQRIYAGEPGSPHAGVDVARPTGPPVAAPADGVVVLAAASPFTLEGHLLMIDHGLRLNSAFLHLSRLDVRVGDRVSRGQIVGAIGKTGRATGPHLHWAMSLGTVRLDPQLIAGPMPRQ
ncbi:MAG: peptidase [Sphingomonas bacterium]|nr:peptidase [Sphingomonas bacterium]